MSGDWIKRDSSWLMDDVDVRAVAEEATQPHSEIAYDPVTESYTVVGPFPDAHVATLEAERIKDELNRVAGHPDYPPIQTWIALHFPPERQPPEAMEPAGPTP